MTTDALPRLNPWIDVSIGDRVRVDNYSSSRNGWEGTVLPREEDGQAMKTSAFGHKWALVDFGEKRGTRSMRTSELDIIVDPSTNAPPMHASSNGHVAGRLTEPPPVV